MKKSNVIVRRSDFTKGRRSKRNARDSDQQINDKMISRFNKKCKKERIVNECKEKARFVSKKDKRKKKRARAIKRINKLLRSAR